MNANDIDDVEQDIDLGNDASQIRRREQYNNSDNRRNLCQHLDEDEIFCPAFEQNVALGMNNIQFVRNETAGVATRRPFNPTSIFIPLSTLLSVGPNHGTNLILIILSITSIVENNLTKYQKSFKNNQGIVDSVCHVCRMVVMCPLSPIGSNTAIILFGAGCCKRLFEGDISLRDNGQIRKFFIIYLILTQINISTTNVLFC